MILANLARMHARIHSPCATPEYPPCLPELEEAAPFVQNDAEPHCPVAPGCSTLDGPAT